MKSELKCRHYWERKNRCCNKDIQEHEYSDCPYYGESVVNLKNFIGTIAFKELSKVTDIKTIKCSGFTPQELWCDNYRSTYQDGTKHKCK